MHPVLLKIPIFGGLTIYTYGFMVAAGFVAGIIWIIRECKRTNLNPALALDLVFYVLVSAILGSRLMFLIVASPSRIIYEPWSIFMIWEGGLVFYGGLIAALAVSVFYLWRKKMSVSAYADLFAPAIALGHAFGRMGCFLVGCCYGKVAPASAWYAVTFPTNPNTFAPPGEPLYPTQLIECLGELLIFLGLALFRKHRSFTGQIMALYLICYSVLRFFNEFLRADPDRGYPFGGPISTSQMVSIGLFIAGVVILVRGLKRRG